MRKASSVIAGIIMIITVIAFVINIMLINSIVTSIVITPVTICVIVIINTKTGAPSGHYTGLVGHYTD